LATLRAGEPAPDAVVSLWKDAGARRIDLSELADGDVRALVEAALGDPVEEAALRWVVEVGRGNALFVRELVGGAVDAGTLVHGQGFWRLEGTPAAPQSLIELVEERLEGPQRETVELLALGEPLRIGELDESALIAAEARGLVELRGDEVGLAHPLYG